VSLAWSTTTWMMEHELSCWPCCRRCYDQACTSLQRMHWHAAHFVNSGSGAAISAILATQLAHAAACRGPMQQGAGLDTTGA
jgi:hypothetical protein